MTLVYQLVLVFHLFLEIFLGPPIEFIKNLWNLIILFLFQKSSGPLNYGNYNNPKYDKLVDDALSELDIDIRAKKLKEETNSKYVEQITNFILSDSDRSFLVPGDL